VPSLHKEAADAVLPLHEEATDTAPPLREESATNAAPPPPDAGEVAPPAATTRGYREAAPSLQESTNATPPPDDGKVMVLLLREVEWPRRLRRRCARRPRAEEACRLIGASMLADRSKEAMISFTPTDWSKQGANQCKQACLLCMVRVEEGLVFFF